MKEHVELADRLPGNGWHRDGEIAGKATVWHRHDDHDAEIVLPVTADLRDYEQRMAEAWARYGEWLVRE